MTEVAVHVRQPLHKLWPVGGPKARGTKGARRLVLAPETEIEGRGFRSANEPFEVMIVALFRADGTSLLHHVDMCIFHGHEPDLVGVEDLGRFGPQHPCEVVVLPFARHDVVVDLTLVGERA